MYDLMQDVRVIPKCSGLGAVPTRTFDVFGKWTKPILASLEVEFSSRYELKYLLDQPSK